MAEVKWIKIVTDVFNNKKIKQIDAMPDSDTILVIWFKLLCLAGSINDGGQLILTKDLAYTDEMMSTEFRKPINTIRLALGVFEQFGMIEIINNIYRVSNWEKYQNIQGLEKIREQTRERVSRHREKQKNIPCNVTVTQGNATDIDKELDKNKNKDIKNTCTSADALFDLVFNLYPVKRGRNAVKKTQREKLLKIGYDELKRAIDRYISEQQAKGTELKYYKQGSTFFNSGYVDYLDANFKELSPQGKVSKQIDYNNQEIF